MVRLTKIYTRSGDSGETHLGDMSRVSKAHPRVESYGDVDELNSVIGVVRTLDPPAAVDALLEQIQNELFDLGADLCVPGAGDDRLRVSDEQVEALEHECDTANEALESLESFVLPGGSPLAANLHHARTVCRRAERSVTALMGQEPDGVNPSALRYLNRLSDLLFVLARAANHGARGDVLWMPGETRGGATGE